MRKLEALEAEFPELKVPESPSQKVGAAPLETFSKVRHGVPMLSLNNAFSDEEVREWDARIRKFLGLKPEEKIDYVLEPKIDGLSFTARYEHGRFTQGATRGDGEVGEDVTRNLAAILPSGLQGEDYPAKLEVRGEVFMSHEKFRKLNEERKENSEPEFANPRNAAAGSLRQLDAEITRARQLDYYVYGWGELSGSAGESQAEFRAKLHRWGFNTTEAVFPHARGDIAFALAWHETVRTRRPALDFDIDGHSL